MTISIHLLEDTVPSTGKVNPLKPKLVEIVFKNSVRTAKKTLHFTITKINWLTLFKELIVVYCENYTNHINTKWRVIDF
jgi:hypothetical protein